MAGIRKAAKWVAEGKIVARRSYPDYRYKRGPFGHWRMSFKSDEWTEKVRLLHDDFTATDWQIVP